MDWDEMQERFNEGPEDFADYPEDEMPDNACPQCGDDMSNPTVGMCETSDGDYICISCYSAEYDKAYDRFKERDL